ncbi:MAG TPA: hypothetical protein VIB11_17610, partial [Pedococcus sp.]
IGSLPKKAQPLHDGVGKLLAGLGDAESADTLLYGVDQVRAGLSAATTAGGSVDQLKGGTDQSRAGVDQVKAGLDAALAADGSIDQAEAAITSIGSVPACAADPMCAQTVMGVAAAVESKLRENTGAASAGLGQVSGGLGQVSGGLGTLKSKLSDAVVGLVKVQCGLSNETLPVCDASKPGLVQGLGALDAGVTQLVNGVVTNVQGGVGDADDLPEDETLRGGVHGLMGGVDLIGEGGMTLLDGLDQLGAGADELAAGSGELADGAGQLDEGLGELADGAGKLDDGAGQLSHGAGQLSDGLGDAADGSGKIADGLEEAAGGAPKLEDGAQRLSDEGTQKLVEAGKSTAADYGQKYALIEAGAERAKTEGMAYGAPADAAGVTAYSFELAGMTGEGSRNLGRSAGALAIFGLAGGAAFLRRRFL